jgi:hypothetical protein
MTKTRPHLAILGAGPTGLEAALAATDLAYPFTLYEAAASAAGHVRDWGHVRLFSPWSLNASPRMRRHLAAIGLEPPGGDHCPTGHALAERLLDPIARLPSVAPNLRLRTRVAAVGREGLLKHEEIGTAKRSRQRFRLLLVDAAGREWVEGADLVLDCSGTYGSPNPLGDGGIPAPGEGRLGAAISRRIPDLPAEAEQWAGQTTLLVGAGHSAQSAAVALAALAEGSPDTRVIWALRRADPLWDVDPDDPLPERSRLMAAAQSLARGGSSAFETVPGVGVDALTRDNGRLLVTLRDSEAKSRRLAVDRVLSLTGSVGDPRLYRQLQVHECYATAAPMKLAAALLGPSGRDCLTQESHGAETLVNPEPGFFILGAKSYGRNSTFLMRVGWQQVAEVFSLLGGDSPALMRG